MLRTFVVGILLMSYSAQSVRETLVHLEAEKECTPCECGCSGEGNASLMPYCAARQACLAAAASSDLKVFPNFDAEYCEEMLSEDELCQPAPSAGREATNPLDLEAGRVELVQKVIAVVKSDVSSLEMVSCGDVDVADAEGNSTAKFSSCKVCTDSAHQGGVMGSQATTHNCAYVESTDRCVAEHDAPATGAVLDLLDCRQFMPAAVIEDANALIEANSEQKHEQTWDKREIKQKFWDMFGTKNDTEQCCCATFGCPVDLIRRQAAWEWHRDGASKKMCCKRIHGCEGKTGFFGRDYSDTAFHLKSEEITTAQSLCSTSDRQVERKGSDNVRAFLVAYGYKKPNELKGTFFDILVAYRELIKRGIKPEHITVLTDVDDVHYEYGSDEPVRAAQSYFHEKVNFRVAKFGTPAEFYSAMDFAISGLVTDGFFYIHLSGHGVTKPDKNDDELDGWDETFVAPNMERIVDDDFYEKLLKIPAGVKVFAVADACHSEGFSDLPFNYVAPTDKWCTDWQTLKRDTPRAQIVFVSGSQNYQTSVDLGAPWRESDMRPGGALTKYMFEEWLQVSTRDIDQPVSARMRNIQKALRGQDPSLSAFPPFRSGEIFDPFNMKTTMRLDLTGRDYDEAKALSQSHFDDTEHVVLVGPNFCSHGGKHKGIAHTRRKRAQEAIDALRNENVSESSPTFFQNVFGGGESAPEDEPNGFLIDERLDDARDSLPEDAFYGWTAGHKGKMGSKRTQRIDLNKMA